MEAEKDMEIDSKWNVKFKADLRRFKNNSLFQQPLPEFMNIKGEDDTFLTESTKNTRLSKMILRASKKGKSFGQHHFNK